MTEDTHKTPETIIDEWVVQSAILGRTTNQIEERIDYILKKVFEEFEGVLDHWYIDGAEAGEVGSLHKVINVDEIGHAFCLYARSECSTHPIILIDEVEWDLTSSFPTYWLHSDFEVDLTKGKKLYEDKVAAKKKTRALSNASRKKKTQDLIDQARKKLTDAEAIALGI